MCPDARCDHGFTHACPHPGCERGVFGAQLVVCGIEGAKYFERGFAELSPGVVTAAWVERPKVEVTLARIVRKADEKRKIREELAEVAAGGRR